jgi:hypothetical protein
MEKCEGGEDMAGIRFGFQSGENSINIETERI